MDGVILGFSSSAENRGMESMGRRCSITQRSLLGPRGLRGLGGQTRTSHGSWRNNPVFAALTLFQALKIFIKIITLCHAEQDNKRQHVNHQCSQSISVSYLSSSLLSQS